MSQITINNLTIHRTEFDTMVVTFAEIVRQSTASLSYPEIKKDKDRKTNILAVIDIAKKLHELILESAGFSVYECPGHSAYPEDGCPACGPAYH